MASPPLPAESQLAHLRRRYGDDGRRFVAGLADQVSSCVLRWTLDELQPLDGGLTGANYTAVRGGEQVVLKLSVNAAGVELERLALEHWGPRCAVEVLDHCEGGYLMRRVLPGSHWDGETDAIAAVLADMQAAGPAPAALAAQLVDAHEKLAGYIGQLSAKMEAWPDCPLSPSDFAWAQDALRDLGEAGNRVCHTDMHGRSLLKGEGGQPVVIDPIPTLGTPAFDGAYWAACHQPALTGRRVDELTGLLGCDRDYLLTVSRAAALQEVCAMVRYGIRPDLLGHAVAWAQGR